MLDIAIQKFVLTQLQYPIKNCFILHINKACRFPDLENLFTKVDVTEKIDNHLEEITNSIERFQNLLNSKQVPETPIGPHCNKPYPCRFIPQCWKNVPKPSVFDITSIGEKAWEYFNKQKIELASIPDEELLPRQKIHKTVQLSGTPHINKSNIRKEIESWKWPLFFLDFETISEPIPKFKGTRPFQHIPFQFSCLKQHSPIKDLYNKLPLEDEIIKDSLSVQVHSAFSKENEKSIAPQLHESHYLHNDTSDPRENLIKKIIKFIDNEEGSIPAYYKHFESQRLLELAHTFPQYKEALLNIESRLVDPLPILRENVFFKEFGSSWSIKSIAPVLLGEKWSYSKLQVKDGLMAQFSFYKMIRLDNNDPKKENLRKELVIYCRQDTLTLALIVQWLYENS